MKISSKAFILFLGVAIMIGFIPTAIYAQNDAGSDPEPASQVVIGRVILLDVESNAIQIRDDDYTVYLFTIDPESTVIKKGKEEITLANIQLADVVEVELEYEKVKSINVKE